MATGRTGADGRALGSMSFMNVNGSYGCGAQCTPEFRGVRDLLDHMDYLGIDRALAYNVAARDLDGPFFGNRRLLQDISASPEAAERLIPAFVVSPGDFYETGAMELYERHLGSRSVRALRAFSFLPQMGRVLDRLRRFGPLVLFSMQAGADHAATESMVKLARDFPDLTFVCTDVMWGQYNALFDMMWRCPNLLVDSSWMHARDSIRFVVERFGAKRILFGTGPKAHYGAAVAALTHARISDDIRAGVAAASLERLLGLAPLDRSLVRSRPAVLDGKPMWQSFRAGAPVRDVRVVDAHGHLGHALAGWVLGESMGSISADLIAHMDGAGVSRMLVSATTAIGGDPVEANRLLAADLVGHRDRFTGYLTYNPHYGKTMAPLLDEFFRDPFFGGFKVHPHRWRLALDDVGYEPVWRYAHEHRLPVLIHTWDTPHASPRLLQEIVGRFPKAVFLLGHSGGGSEGRRQAVELARAHENVLLEFCGSFCSTIPWDETIGEVGNDRVVFGSDTFLHDLPWELGRLLSTPLPDRELVPILGSNLQSILDRRVKLGARTDAR
jgi:uncharacterized protein